MSEMGMAKKALIVGASSDIGGALLAQPQLAGWEVGAHCHQGRERLEHALAAAGKAFSRCRTFEASLDSQAQCHGLVDDFVAWAGGIDALVQLSGHVADPCRWDALSENAWNSDLAVNLAAPFFLAQRAFHFMRPGGGRIVLMSTASAAHGGGATTMAYGVAKAGVECLAKGLARDGASHGILVNAVAPGLIDTRFHRDRLGRSAEDMQRRASLVPLKRAGTPADVAAMIAYLLSAGGDYITGQVLAISGGDWL